MTNENVTLKNQVLELQNKCDEIKSMLEVLMGIKTNVNDKSPSPEDTPIVCEQVPDFKTLKVTLETKKLTTLVYEMLTNKSQESFENQSPEDKLTTRRPFNEQRNVVKIFVKFMGNIPRKPFNMAHMFEWKDTMRILIDHSYEKLKNYMDTHNLIKRKPKKGHITVANLKNPAIKRHFANSGNITWDIRNNSEDNVPDNDSLAIETQDESIEVEDVHESIEVEHV